MKLDNRLILGATLVSLASFPVINHNFSLLQEKIQPVSASVKMGDKTIFLEVADTSSERLKGLMGRSLLSSDRGMLFVFDPPARSATFWMKDTYIPLDILFLNNGRVVHITRNAQPCRPDYCPKISPPGFAPLVDQVIEVNAGIADPINTGDFLLVSPK
jgi:uncharacterized membrane protein (UPF0127 family)